MMNMRELNATFFPLNIFLTTRPSLQTPPGTQIFLQVPYPSGPKVKKNATLQALSDTDFCPENSFLTYKFIFTMVTTTKGKKSLMLRSTCKD